MKIRHSSRYVNLRVHRYVQHRLTTR